MKNSRKDFESEFYKAFRRAAELELADEISPEEANRMFPPPCEFKDLLSKYEEKQKDERASSIAQKRNSFSPILKSAAAVLAIVVLMPLILVSGKHLKFTKEYGYTIAESISGYEYYKERGPFFLTNEKYSLFQEIGPIHRKYVPTYIPEGCSYTSYDFDPSFNYEASYSFYDIDEETGEYGDAVKVIIFASKTHTSGISNKVAKHPEIIELPNGDYGVIVKDKKTDRIIRLFWANDEISISISSYKLPFEELVKILEGIKYTTEFTE